MGVEWLIEKHKKWLERQLQLPEDVRFGGHKSGRAWVESLLNPESVTEGDSLKMKIESMERLEVLNSALIKDIANLEVCARTLKTQSIFQEVEAYVGQFDEMRANIDLAIRHLEDAQLRLWMLSLCARNMGDIYTATRKTSLAE